MSSRGEKRILGASQGRSPIRGTRRGREQNQQILTCDKVGNRQHKVFKIFGTGVKPASVDDSLSWQK